MRKLMILLILLLIPHLVSAGVISLTTTISTDIMTEDVTKIHVKLLNSGDEPAHSVQVSLLATGFNANPILVGKLNPNEPFEEDFEVTLTEEILPGSYPIVVLTDYTDANGYPFSSVSPSSIVYKTSTVSKVSGLMYEVNLTNKESKKLTLSIRNLDYIEHGVNIKLILPREIKVVDDEKKISIGPKQEKSLDYEVSSLSAISGSAYAVVASIEYEDELHYSSFANGIIKIDGGAVSKTQEPEETSTLGYIVLFISIIFVLVYVYQKYIKRGKKIEKEKR